MPVVTLSTDIGQADFITGAIKGQLISADPTNIIVDITHQLSQSNYQHTAYICNSAFRHFPSGTFHIVIVNLFDSPPQHMLVAEHKGQYIACPDNGILTTICGIKPANILAVEVLPRPSFDTLACTHAIAHAFKKLNYGEPVRLIGEPITDIKEKYPLRPSVGADWMEGQIIFIDGFENVVANITRDEFEELRRGRSFTIMFTRGEVIEKISQNYASAGAGDKVAWFNSAGYLELALNKGNMAGLFGLTGYTDNPLLQAAMHNKLLYQTVKIYFGQ